MIVLGVVVLGDASLRDLFGLGAIRPAAVRQTAPADQRGVIYRVTGSGTSSASVTYNNGQGGTEQRKVELPWELPFTTKVDEFVYLSAQNQEDQGGVTVEILIDGQPWKKSVSEGAYTIATASDNVPSGSF